MQTKEILREFIFRELKKSHGESLGQFKDSDSIFLSDKADSLFFVDLLVFLDSKFSRKLDPASVSMEDLDTIDKLAALLDSKP